MAGTVPEMELGAEGPDCVSNLDDNYELPVE